jgi:hypothetical protein
VQATACAQYLSRAFTSSGLSPAKRNETKRVRMTADADKIEGGEREIKFKSHADEW